MSFSETSWDDISVATTWDEEERLQRQQASLLQQTNLHRRQRYVDASSRASLGTSLRIQNKDRQVDFNSIQNKIEAIWDSVIQFTEDEIKDQCQDHVEIEENRLIELINHTTRYVIVMLVLGGEVEIAQPSQILSPDKSTINIKSIRFEELPDFVFFKKQWTMRMFRARIDEFIVLLFSILGIKDLQDAEYMHSGLNAECELDVGLEEKDRMSDGSFTTFNESDVASQDERSHANLLELIDHLSSMNLVTAFEIFSSKINRGNFVKGWGHIVRYLWKTISKNMDNEALPEPFVDEDVLELLWNEFSNEREVLYGVQANRLTRWSLFRSFTDPDAVDARIRQIRSSANLFTVSLKMLERFQVERWCRARHLWSHIQQLDYLLSILSRLPNLQREAAIFIQETVSHLDIESCRCMISYLDIDDFLLLVKLRPPDSKISRLQFSSNFCAFLEFCLQYSSVIDYSLI